MKSTTDPQRREVVPFPYARRGRRLGQSSLRGFALEVAVLLTAGAAAVWFYWLTTG